MLFIFVTLFINGCTMGDEPSQAPTQEVYLLAESEAVSEAPEYATPEDAIAEIYEQVDILGIFTPDEEYISEVLGIEPSYYEEVYIRITDGAYGVADVYIIKPTKDFEAEVKAKLEQIKQLKINEFEDYNILGSFEIATNAAIYTQGEYLVMLMIEDMASAEEIINKYIPR